MKSRIDLLQLRSNCPVTTPSCNSVPDVTIAVQSPDDRHRTCELRTETNHEARGKAQGRNEAWMGHDTSAIC